MKKKSTVSRLAGIMMALLLPTVARSEIPAPVEITAPVEISYPVEISETNFPDPPFIQLITDNGYDVNGDGLLRKEEAEAVKHIDCTEKGIESLKGIEYFTKLTALHCSKNQLIGLDVSQNKALTNDNLVCESNQYSIRFNQEGTFDLCTLPGKPDPEKRACTSSFACRFYAMMMSPRPVIMPILDCGWVC